jgi:hypothetical protein
MAHGERWQLRGVGGVRTDISWIASRRGAERNMRGETGRGQETEEQGTGRSDRRNGCRDSR